jgi:hypothetical protein
MIQLGAALQLLTKVGCATLKGRSVVERPFLSITDVE